MSETAGIMCYGCEQWKAAKRVKSRVQHKCAYRVAVMGEDETLCNCCQSCMARCDVMATDLLRTVAS